MRVHFLFIFIFLGLAACEKGPTLGPGDENSLASAAQADCGFLQNAYGQRVSWKSKIPVVLKLHKSYPEEFIAILEKSADHWNEAAGLTLFRFERDDSMASATVAKDKVNTIHWMKDWDETLRSQQAVTNLYWQGSQLTESDIAIDNKFFSFFLDQPNTTSDVHLESLLVHELGHVLGLKHRSTVPSVMWAILNGGLIRNVLTAADRETVKCEY